MSRPDATPTSTSTIERLHGVYDADGTKFGEVAYWIGARLGRRHCSLCEITHGVFRRRADWTACRAGLPVPFDTHHRDDQPAGVRDAADGRAPVVVAATDDGHVLLLSPDELDACDCRIDRLLERIEDAASRLGLSWSAA